MTRRDCVWGWVLCWASYWIAVANKGDDVVVTGSTIVAVLIGLVSAAVGAHTTLGWVRGRSSDPSLPAEMSPAPALKEEEKTAAYGSTGPSGV